MAHVQNHSIHGDCDFLVALRITHFTHRYASIVHIPIPHFTLCITHFTNNAVLRLCLGYSRTFMCNLSVSHAHISAPHNVFLHWWNMTFLRPPNPRLNAILHVSDETKQ